MTPRSRRRADGELQAELLTVLWQAGGRPMTPAQVRDALGDALAYTTVTTVLSRLWQRGLVSRREVGRGYAYRAEVTESEIASRRLSAAFDSAQDRASALALFVGTLTPDEVIGLRRLLDELED